MDRIERLRERSLVAGGERVGGAPGPPTALVALSTPAPNHSPALPCGAPRTPGAYACWASQHATDERWEQLRPFLPPQKPQTGRPATDHCLIVEGMPGSHLPVPAFRELPERFGPWSTVASRYQRWVKEGLWTRILQVLLPFEAAFLSSDLFS